MDPLTPEGKTVSLGDGFPPDPTTAVLHHDFMMTIPVSLSSSLVYQWDTTTVNDGVHTLELKDETNGLSPYKVTINVDNTQPKIKVNTRSRKNI